MKKLATLFSQSRQEFKLVRTVTVCAMMGALGMVLGAFTIYIGPSSRVGFSGIPNMVVAYLFGPVVGCLFNGTMDILKYVIKPVGGFFPGMTLVTMLAGLIYGSFFYKRPMKLWRVLAAGFVVAVVCNVWLNTYCLSILLGKGFWGMLPARIVQNAITWPLHSLAFYYTAKLLEMAGVFKILGLKPLLRTAPENEGKTTENR